MMALLSYYSHFTLDVDNMDDTELAKKWGYLVYSLEQTNQFKN